MRLLTRIIVNDCVVFCKLSSREVLSIQKCLFSKLIAFPMWFSHEVLDQNFSSVLDNVLIDCVSRFSPNLPRARSKKEHVRMLLSHSMATRRNIMQLNEEQLQEALSGSTTTSAETPSQLVPWLARHFRDLYGQKFFLPLCRPPAQIYALDLLDAPRISWSSLICSSFKDLIQRLHKLTIEVRFALERARSRYSGLLNTYDMRGTRVVSPDVRYEKGVRIHVSENNSKLKEGAIIELEVILNCPP